MNRSAVSIAFTKKGIRMFNQLNHKLGKHHIDIDVMRNELSMYIHAHEAAGKLDTQYQLLRYTSNICIALRKEQGTWLILNLFLIYAGKEFRPVYIWKQFREGIKTILCLVLVCWRTSIPPVMTKSTYNCV